MNRLVAGHEPGCKYRPDIDGLRAIAVVLVVIFHAFPRFIKGGFIGVDVFFVISGYLISTIIFLRLADNNFSYIEFYIRRIKRIFPALMLVIMISACIGWYVLLPDEYQRLGTHIAAGAGFISNFILWSEAGYFDVESFEKPLLHLWSLAIEEQFYIIWPLLLGVIWKMMRGGLLIVFFLILSFSFLANLYLTNSDETSAFYAPWSRFWELMAGCLLAYLHLYKPAPAYLSLKRNWQSVIGLVLIFFAALILNKQSMFPGWWALMPTIGAFLIINAGSSSWINRNFLSRPKLVWLGLISYPLYLWHWPIFSFTRIIFFKEEINPVVFIIAVIISIFFAWLTYNFLEKKVRFNQNGVVGFVLIGICLACGLIGVGIQNKYLTARNDAIDIEFIYKALNDTGKEYESKVMKGQINDLVYHYLESTETDNVLFIGDSHIGHYIPRIVMLAENPELKIKYVYFAIRNGCPMIPDVFDDIIKKCKNAWDERLDFALSSKIKSVVIGGCWNCILTSSVEKPKIISAQDPRKKRALKVLESLLKEIAAKKKVYLLLDSPNNNLFDPRNFFTGSRLQQLSLRKLNEPLQLDHEQKVLREELIAIAHRAGAIVIDPMPSLCHNDKCAILSEEGKPIYTDNHHLSASWTKKYADYIDIAVKASEDGL